MTRATGSSDVRTRAGRPSSAWARGLPAIGLTAALSATAWLTVAAVDAHDAAREHDAAATRHARVAAELAELLHLRSAAERTGPGAPRPLAERIAAALRAAGVPAQSLASLSPEADAAVRTPDGRTSTRRRAQLVLEPLALPELGAFLAAWRAAEPGWTVASIDLAPSRAAPATPGANLPLRASMAMESSSPADTRGTGVGPATSALRDSADPDGFVRTSAEGPR